MVRFSLIEVDHWVREPRWRFATAGRCRCSAQRSAGCCDGHVLRGHVHGVGGGQQRAVGLWLQVAVGGLHIAVGKGIAGLAVDADDIGGRGHAAVDDARRAGQHQHGLAGV